MTATEHAVLPSAPLTRDDIGAYVVYQGGGHPETGRIKRFDNVHRIAWVVYQADGHLDTDQEWRRYTAEATPYSQLAWRDPR